MKWYAIAEFDIDDPTWIASYVSAVTPMVERFGGRFLARTPHVEKLEGTRPVAQVMLVVEWPSRDAAHAFYASEEYAPFLQARRAASRGEVTLVAGEDATGVASVPGHDAERS